MPSAAIEVVTCAATECPLSSGRAFCSHACPLPSHCALSSNGLPSALRLCPLQQQNAVCPQIVPSALKSCPCSNRLLQQLCFQPCNLCFVRRRRTRLHASGSHVCIDHATASCRCCLCWASVFCETDTYVSLDRLAAMATAVCQTL